jgi:GrpB-like predicted nucleotidyltransferase (UPF0157 family)
MKFIKYKFRPYNLKYQQLFRLEKARLKKILGKNIDIEHIGSTAVKDLGGKGIIDVLIGANKKDISQVINRLKKSKYTFSIRGDKNRWCFQKDYKHAGKIRRVHLQLVPKKSKNWSDPLKTRDILRKNKKLREEYVKTKKKALKIAKGEGKKYRAFKRNFLDEIEKSK